MSGGDVLSDRALNRATLARQLLLERSTRSAYDAVESLVGMQSQAPRAPYVGLWSRLDGFDPGELSELTARRRVVRAGLMRNTIHLVTAADCVALQPWLNPQRLRVFKSTVFARDCAGVDLDELTEAARAAVEVEPLSRTQLGAALAGRWPDRSSNSLAYAATFLLPMIQVTPRGLWESSAPPRWTTYDSWLGADATAVPPIQPEHVVLRYLAAYGPASVMDCQKWCGLTRLREVFDRLRERLRIFRSEAGATLYDLPDAPRPTPDTPAPVRFLGEYDNLLLSHADRRRVMTAGTLVPLPPGDGGLTGTVLIDGRYDATWRLVRQADRVTLSIDPLRALTKSEQASAEVEGLDLLSLLAPGGHAPSVVVGRASP
jgi:hypothetical protein